MTSPDRTCRAMARSDRARARGIAPLPEEWGI